MSGSSPARSALLKLESAVCDATNMASLAATFLEQTFSYSTHKKSETIELCVWQTDLIMFAIYQARFMATQLHEEYYAALERSKGT